MSNLWYSVQGFQRLAIKKAYYLLGRKKMFQIVVPYFIGKNGTGH